MTIVSVFGYEGGEDKEKLNILKEPLLTTALQQIGKGNLPFCMNQYLPAWWNQEKMVDVDTISDNSFLVTADGSLSMNDISESAEAGNAMEDPMKQYEYQLVGNEYFDDAVFIGDSRTDGLARYSGLDNATFYAKNSLSIYDFFDKKFIQLEDEKEKITLEQALERKKYGKVYIMFGINELGSGSPERFGATYLKVLTRIRELQPEAILFVQGIMRVTGTKSASDNVFNNENINYRNAMLATIDNHHDIFYLEVNDAVCDENGDLNAEYTFDEVHLKASYYYLWVDYLKQHGIIKGI